MKRRGKIAIAIAAAGTAVVAVVGAAALGLFEDSTSGGRNRLCATQPTGASVPSPAPATRIVATGLCIPWGLAFLPDGTALVTERDSARILAVSADGRLSVVQEIADAFPRGESGLLGLAVSPNYGTDKLVYAYYTTRSDNRVVRFRLGEQPQPVLAGIPLEERHDGGRIAFGPDGMLYVAVGDTDRRELAQDRGVLVGKILRITPDGQPAPGNPFPDSPIWSLGHRNVQGLAWDSRGRLFATEFGQDRIDELNLIEPGGNYGWPEVEGIGRDPRFVDPIATWAPADASPSGLAIVNDQAYVACLRGRRLYRVDLSGGQGGQGGQGGGQGGQGEQRAQGGQGEQRAQGGQGGGQGGPGKQRGQPTPTPMSTLAPPVPLLANEYGRLRTVAAGPDGALWILTSNRDPRGRPISTDDRLIRMPPP
ncbi:MAG TPA: PQQ-dependent sugar dehydrogenase [Candidatus Limnocylindrales bacterium]